jgi:hypothetical protein
MAHRTLLSGVQGLDKMGLTLQSKKERSDGDSAKAGKTTVREIEEALSKVGVRDARTLKMRLDHVFFELETFIRDERADAKLRGPRLRPHIEFWIKQLEVKLTEIRSDLEKINYVEVD